MKCTFYVHFSAEITGPKYGRKVKSVKADRLTQTGKPTSFAPYVVKFEVEIPPENILPQTVQVDNLAADAAVQVLKAVHSELKSQP